MNKKGNNIAVLSLLSKAINILGGPITLLIISSKLSTEEIAFYYTFFNLIALQQLVELGLGFTLKQNMSHAFKIDGGEWSNDSKKNIKSYFSFGLKWFLMISVFIILFIGPVGYFYYYGYNGTVNWKLAWCCLIIILSFSILLSPIMIFLESTQNQLIVYKSQLIFSFFNIIALWFFLYFDFKLLSIALSLFISNLILLVLLLLLGGNVIREIMIIKAERKFKDTFLELWPLFSRVSIVWGFGFMFWNGFNLISFKIFDENIAGKIILTITLARSGYIIAETICNSQTTIIANMISNKKYLIAKEYYKKYKIISIFLLVLGYFSFVCLNYFYPSFYLFKKTMPIEYVLSVFLFFLILLLLTLNNNYIRCYKIEPFVKVSIWHSLAVPIVYFYTAKIGFALYPCTIILMVSLYWSKKVSDKIIDEKGVLLNGK